MPRRILSFWSCELSFFQDVSQNCFVGFVHIHFLRKSEISQNCQLSDRCVDGWIRLDWIRLDSSSTAQGGGGSFKNRKPIGEVGCCESGMAERSHWRTERCLRSPLFLSLSLAIYLPTHLFSMYLSICWSSYLSLSFSLSSHYLSTYLPIYLSIYLSLSLSSVYLSSCLPVYLSISLSFIGLSV